MTAGTIDQVLARENLRGICFVMARRDGDADLKRDVRTYVVPLNPDWSNHAEVRRCGDSLAESRAWTAANLREGFDDAAAICLCADSTGSSVVKYVRPDWQGTPWLVAVVDGLAQQLHEDGPRQSRLWAAVEFIKQVIRRRWPN